MGRGRHLLLCLGLSILASAAWADDASLRQPMQIALVRSAKADCKPDCSEWIAAQGSIEAETPARLRAVLRQLNGRKLPILLASYGGSAEAAYAMGREIRKAGLDTGVAATRFEAPPEKGRSKPPLWLEGRADGYLTICASACSFVLAGGMQRVVPPTAMIGVHQLTLKTTRTRTERFYRVLYREDDHSEISRRLVRQTSSVRTTLKGYPTGQVVKTVARYLAEMGIDPSFIELTSAVPASSIRVLLRSELSQTRIATHTASLEPLLPSIASNRAAARAQVALLRAQPVKARPPVQTTVIGRVPVGETNGRPLTMEFAISADNSALMVHAYIRLLQAEDAVATRLLRIRISLPTGYEAIGYNETPERPDGPIKVSLLRGRLCSLDAASPVTVEIARRTGEPVAGMPAPAGPAGSVLPLDALRRSFCDAGSSPGG